MSLVLLKHEHELVFGNLMLCPTRRGIDRQCLVTNSLFGWLVAGGWC
jgi:hypothetical protein